MPSLVFRRRFDLSTLPRDWHPVSLSLDWSGNPLLLMAEGKLPQPERGDTTQAWSLWYRTPARAHHVLYWEADRPRTLRFDQSQAPSTYHVQPLGEGWLLAERRRGHATVYDSQGRVCAALDLGDASEDLQTTPDGKIWVSYFDEGVLGSGLGAHGVVCFDHAGTPLFKYREFAAKHDLPPIHDCYAMNVADHGAVWLNYYNEFPLVLLRNFELETIWREFAHMGNAFAMRGREAVYWRDGQCLRAALDTRSEPEIIHAVDELGFPLTPISGHRSSVAARGPGLILRAGNFLYDLLK